MDGCPFYEYFFENYQNKRTRPFKTPGHVCCCQNDDFPHNEDEKFIIIYGDNEARDKEKLRIPLYQDFMPGKLIDSEDTGKLIRKSKL